ncbi:ribose-phosphate pyrophosphokinase-like domain-containing protein, partial [Candidatus Woesearchaeota archaeon]|nr:ribose-phosphate pyrophosphokinase-like domain-containing protein [Candidatus Woesearchaeota archaeon]
MIEIDNGLEILVQNGFAIASATSDNQFARTLAGLCGVQSKIDDLVFNPRKFTGGEYCPVAVPEAIEGKRVYLVASPNPSKGTPQDLFGRILIATDTLKRNGAEEVWLLAPDMHYSRQDRGPHDVKEREKAKKKSAEHKMKGQPLTAIVQAKHFKTAGISRVVPVHMHSTKLYKIYGGAWLGIDEYHPEWNDPQWEEKLIAKGKEILISLNPAPLAAHYIRNRSSIADEIKPDGSNLVWLCPDAGSVEFTEQVRHYTFWSKSWVIKCDKIRTEPNDESKVRIEIPEWPLGLSLEDKYVVICDDGSETGGTLGKATTGLRRVQYIRKEEGIGEPKAVLVYITHPWLNGPYNEMTQKKLAGIKGIKEIIVGNTWTNIDDGRVARFKEISTVLRFAQFY